MCVWITLTLAWLLVTGSKAESEARDSGTVLTNRPTKPMKLVEGHNLISLGQSWGSTAPLLHTSINLSNISRASSTFEFRTFDPEGLVFYGDTHDGADWFVLALRDGVPEMHIKRADILTCVFGSARLNDGRWHEIGLRSSGKFVVLEVDQQVALMVGLSSPLAELQPQMAEVMRLALGGILIKEEQLLKPLSLPMDGCVRNGQWLHVSSLWETEVDLTPQLCSAPIRPGSYFSARGLASYNTSHVESAETAVRHKQDNVSVEVEGQVEQWSGTILSLITQSGTSVVSLSVHKNMMIKYGSEEQSLSLSPGVTLVALVLSQHHYHIQYGSVSLKILQKADDKSDWLDEWRNGMVLTFGGLADRLGQTDHLQGCVDKIKVQGQVLDLDRAEYKHTSVSSHSCPSQPAAQQTYV